LRRALAGLGSLIAWLFEVATVPRAERRARNPAEIARELQRIDETLHNVEGCIVQLQGKMLTLGGG
jgi:tetrahydromethanopterin S-methyltransferase subunit G